ncbi:MAG: molybdopterin-dependent oxidoreductase [Sedimentisphaerales bacterium]
MNRSTWTLLLIALLWFLPAAGYGLEPPPITPNDEFFTLGQAPDVPDDWTLDIVGEVVHPLSLSLDELKRYPRQDVEGTLECNYPIGPPLLVSSAVWTGVSLNALLEQAGLKPSARAITFRALDGYRVGPFSLAEIMERTDIIVAYEMNGETLPESQGWPAKIVLPGCVGYQWLRWLDRIEISTSAASESLRPWPIHARIFEPEYNSTVNECSYTITGMVNAGDGKEIAQVEVSTDDGVTWDRAEILNYFLPNVWKQWQYEWEIEKPGLYTIYARVRDADGNAQNELGSYGWSGYRIIVTADRDINCSNLQRADLDKDGYVDFSDFSLLADQWLMTGVGFSADVVPLEGDGQVNLRDLMLVADEWLRCFVQPASDPSPAVGEENVAFTPLLLEWSPEEGSVYNDVYLGTDLVSVATATHHSQVFLGSVTDNRFELEQTLEPNTVYYWRVNRIGPKCTTPGDIWNFRTGKGVTTEPDPAIGSTDIPAPTAN